jgi:hypothetical protein
MVNMESWVYVSFVTRERLKRELEKISQLAVVFCGSATCVICVLLENAW